MLTQKDQRTIRSKLDNIYKIFLSKKDINYFENQILQIIKNFNKKNPKQKKNISEKEYSNQLSHQIHSPVMWSETVKSIMSEEINTFIEIGPKKTLLKF